MSTGLSGLLSDSTSDTSVTSGDDDGLHSSIKLKAQSRIPLYDTLYMSRLATGLTLPERSMFQPVPTIFVFMFCCFVGEVGVQGSFVMMRMGWRRCYGIE